MLQLLGLLHDIGKVVLVSQLQEDYEKVVAYANEHGVHSRGRVGGCLVCRTTKWVSG